MTVPAALVKEELAVRSRCSQGAVAETNPDACSVGAADIYDPSARLSRRGADRLDAALAALHERALNSVPAAQDVERMVDGVALSDGAEV
jgi:hypothetical protein